MSEPVLPETPPVVDPGAPETPSYDWRTDIHPDVKDDKLWSSVPDVKTLTKIAADGQRYAVGAIKIPAADAPAEEWGKVYDKLGRPASPEGYSVPEGHAEAATLSALRGTAHSVGITEKQWQGLLQGLDRVSSERVGQERAVVQEATQALQTEWGGAYDRKLGLAQRAIKLGGEELWEKISKNPLGNDAAFIRWVAQVGEALAEESLISDSFETVTDRSTALAEIDSLTLSEAYLKPSHPNHRQTVEKVQKLFELVYN